MAHFTIMRSKNKVPVLLYRHEVQWWEASKIMEQKEKMLPQPYLQVGPLFLPKSELVISLHPGHSFIKGPLSGGLRQSSRVRTRLTQPSSLICSTDSPPATPHLFFSLLLLLHIH
jgi:hypothetical protein